MNYEQYTRYEPSAESIQFLREYFKSQDTNNSGHLNIDELDECLKILGFEATSDADLEFIKKQMDKDGNGKLEIEELLQNVHFINFHVLKKQELMEAFKKYDLNKDGSLTLRELEEVLMEEGMTVDEVKPLLRKISQKYDRDFNGKIDYMEFCEMGILEDYDFLQKLKKPEKSKPAKSKAKKK